jgi:CRISPR/Cas system-associated exonuclease Cas4 (RecB family)
MKASYSKVSTYSFCPKKYEYRYVQERPAPQKPELAFGIALHAALEFNFEQKILSRKDLPLEQLVGAFRASLEEGLKNVPEEFLRGPSEFHYLRGMGEHFLERFMKERAPAMQPAPRGVECPFRIPLPGGHEISGKFDLMDTDWVLHDFKTSNKPYDPRKADKTQLVIYAWACERMFGRLPSALCFDVFVKGDGAESPLILQEPVMFPVPSPQEMSLVAERLTKQIDKILDVQRLDAFTWSFEPARCHWCEYQPVCQKDWEQSGSPRPVRLPRENLV